MANDFFFDQDRAYTSGWDIAYTAHGSPFSFRIGQDIYTSDDADSQTPPPGEHPYAAWLYAGSDFRYLLRPSLLMTSSLSLGTTGKRALGEKSQELVHRSLDVEKYKGWDSQISERWGWIAEIRLYWQKQLFRTADYQLDLISAFEGRGGNILIDLSTAAGVHFGYRIPSPTATPEPEAAAALYLSLYGERKIIDKNVFLEGVDSSDYRVKPERGVNTLSCGIHWRKGVYQADLDFYFPEREFKGQNRNHRYGLLRLSYWY